MQNNCDGSGPHTDGTVKKMQSGGDANLILCYSCWIRELVWRKARNLELPTESHYDLPAWGTAETYQG